MKCVLTAFLNRGSHTHCHSPLSQQPTLSRVSSPQGGFAASREKWSRSDCGDFASICKQTPLRSKALRCIGLGAEYQRARTNSGRSFQHTIPVEYRRSHGCLASRLTLLAHRPLFTTQLYSRYALRFASGLPDWNSSSPSANPAALPSDLLGKSSQAPAQFDLIAAGPVQDGPVGAAVSVIDQLHSVTGLPWWATLSVTALGTRAQSCKTAVARMCILAVQLLAPLSIPCRCSYGFISTGSASDTSNRRNSTDMEAGVVQ